MRTPLLLRASHPRRVIRISALACTLASVGALVVGPFDAPRASAQAAPPDDPVLLRELVDRLSGDGFGVKAKIMVGSLPVVTPALSIPAGWRVIGGVVRAIPSGSGSGSIIDTSIGFVDAPSGTTSEAIGALTKSLAASGWTALPTGFPGQNGFVVANSPQPSYAQFCVKTANVSISAIKDATSGVVKVSLNTSAIPAGYPSQCGGGPPVTEIPQIPVVYSQLPRLVLPDSVVLVSAGGGGGSPFTNSSSLTIDKADSAAALEAVFAPQLVAAGWQRSGGAANDSASLSTWRKKSGDTPLQATLVIVNAIGSEQRRDLTITVSQEAVAGNGFGGPTYPPPPVVYPVAVNGPPTTAARTKASASAAGKKTPKAPTKKK
jgi:hypothetical protein